MYAKTINYTDYNGIKKSEKLYFNFSKAELAEMELSYEGGYAAYLEKVVEEKDRSKMIKIFKDLILNSYGIKTEEGRFLKSEKIKEDFVSSEAYSEFFMLIISNETVQNEFIKGITNSIATVKQPPKETKGV